MELPKNRRGGCQARESKLFCLHRSPCMLNAFQPNQDSLYPGPVLLDWGPPILKQITIIVSHRIGPQGCRAESIR